MVYPRFLFFLAMFFCFSCGETEKTFVAEENRLIKEIQQRLEELRPLKDSLSSIGIEPEAIHTRFQELLLMSKDIENPRAFINISNQYISDLCAKHEFNPSALQTLSTNFSLAEISFHLKQNELNILNQILLQKLNRIVNLETAK
jgi:hypothetical protein